MPNEFKTLSTGHVLLRNEEDLREWYEDARPTYKIAPDSYPCLATTGFDSETETEPFYTYLSDVQEMVKALEEAGVTDD